MALGGVFLLLKFDARGFERKGEAEGPDAVFDPRHTTLKSRIDSLFFVFKKK